MHPTPKIDPLTARLQPQQVQARDPREALGHHDRFKWLEAFEEKSDEDEEEIVQDDK
jgi:hypothetical protein